MSDLQTTREQLDAVLSDLALVLTRIGDDQFAGPTPCTEFSITDLRQHTLGWLTAFADGYAAADGRCSDHTAVLVADTGAHQVVAAQQVLRDASDDAIDQGVVVGSDAVPSQLVLPMLLWEYQVHGWDLAAATGQPWQPDEAGLLASLAFVPTVLGPEMVGEGKSFGPAVATAPGASPLEQLVALSGRDPHWSAP